MRGRGNNNNRKGPNPLTRSYESNGPDVKIRGTAQQVAEKYAALARDAQSSGDRVMAENYLQHAEHYNRIIATAQAAQAAAQQQQRESQESDDDDDSNERDDRGSRRNERNNAQAGDQRNEQPNGSGPQPVIEGVPAEVAHSQGELSGARGKKSEQGDSQHMNGKNGASEAQPEDEQPRKRTRRPRKPRAEAAASTDEGSSEGAEAGQSEAVN
ncbi:MAG: DUF4167 domain-containing protein [Rhizobiaceae bacterium]|nr:DUF4167 domain-containing protein [Rhizobiaceae bacterium]